MKRKLPLIRELFDTIPIPIFYKDVEGRYLGCNRAFEECLALGAEDLVGRTITAIAPPELAAIYSRADQELFHKGAGQTQTYETKVIWNDGTLHDVIVSKATFCDEAGNLAGLIGTMQDITRYKHSQKELAETREILQAAMDQNPAGIAIAEAPDGRLRYVNEAGLKIRGGTRETIVNGVGTDQYVPVWQLLDLDGRPLKTEEVPLARAVLFGETCRREFIVRRDDQADRIVVGRAAPVKNDSGEVVAGIVVFSDITERKQAEAALRQSEERLRLFIEHAPAALAMFDREMRYLSYSRRWLTDYGLGDRDLRGESHYEVFQEIPENWRAAHRQGLAGQVLRADADLFERRDGSHQWVRWEIRPWYADADQVGGIVIFSEDITDRKQIEEDLWEKNAELERFLYTASHDLKSPVVTIKTFLGMLERNLEQGDLEQVKEDLVFMNNAADKLSRQINGLLEMSRIGRVTTVPERFTFRDVVKEALGYVAGAMVNRVVEVEFDHQPVAFFADRERLVEVWQNLLENAVKYMGEQAAPKIEIGLEKTGRGPVFFIRDNGVGIDPRFHGKVFDLFEKLDSKVAGTGLGLTIVKRVVEHYGGQISVDSQGRNRGTCFRFSLPAALASDRDAPKS